MWSTPAVLAFLSSLESLSWKWTPMIKPIPAVCIFLSTHEVTETGTANDIHPDGVVIFLILSVAEEVTAIICGTLPVVIPQVWHGYKKYWKYRSSQKSGDGTAAKAGNGDLHQSRGMNRGFQKLGESLGTGHLHGIQDVSGEHSEAYGSMIPLKHVVAGATLPGTSIPMNSTVVETLPRHKSPIDDTRIIVKTKFDISRTGADDPHAV